MPSLGYNAVNQPGLGLTKSDPFHQLFQINPCFSTSHGLVSQIGPHFTDSQRFGYAELVKGVVILKHMFILFPWI